MKLVYIIATTTHYLLEKEESIRNGEVLVQPEEHKSRAFKLPWNDRIHVLPILLAGRTLIHFEHLNE